MSGPWIDVSVGLRKGMIRWPKNPPFQARRFHDLRRGDSSNVSLISMGSHTGTHMDAPAHFLRDGKTIDQIPFEAACGRARVLDILDPREIGVSELSRHRVRRGERILFKTLNSRRRWSRNGFERDFVSLSTAAGAHLVEREVRLVGIDYLSVGGYRKNGGEIHRLLLDAGVWIVEGLDLSKAPPGACELACLPLKIIGGDAAPARAWLRKSSRGETFPDP